MCTDVDPFSSTHLLGDSSVLNVNLCVMLMVTDIAITNVLLLWTFKKLLFQAIQTNKTFIGYKLTALLYHIIFMYLLSKQVTIQYQAKESQFHLAFGTCGASAVANCHTIVSTHLTQTLNNRHSIVQLAEVRFVKCFFFFFFFFLFVFFLFF